MNTLGKWLFMLLMSPFMLAGALVALVIGAGRAGYELMDEGVGDWFDET